jgi:hypothetical protein
MHISDPAVPFAEGRLNSLRSAHACPPTRTHAHRDAAK